MQTHFVLERSSELLLTLQHLTLSMKTLDYLGLPLAAAYIDMAINNVAEQIGSEQQVRSISLDNDLDFSSLDGMIDSIFLIAR